MAGLPPSGALQVVFSFDTTGSMSGALREVRGRVSEMLQRLQADIPGVTTAVVAHGDYCDRNKPYLTKHVDFSDNLPELVDFVNNVETTYGGDEPEAYEVMLRLVRKDLTWQPSSQKVLVVIGDAFPHAADDPQNTDKIDWRQETLWLQEMGVRIYGVQVNDSDQSAEFFKTLTDVTEGQHLKLSQFGTLCDVIMAICYREKGAEFLHNYEAEVRAREGRMALHKDLEGVFGTLRRVGSAASTTPALGLAKTDSIKTLPKKASITKSPSVTTAKKLVARAVKTRDIKPTAKCLSKTRKGTHARKLIREKVPDTNFRFNQLGWSPWKLVAVPVAEAGIRSGQWRRILKGSARARSGAVVSGEQAARAKGSIMCEVSVQTRPGHAVTWCGAAYCPRPQLVVCLFPVSLSSPSVRAQLDRVMRNGCRVWVRWAKVKQGEAEVEVKQKIKDMYDYAWCTRNGCHREVWVPNGMPLHRVQIAGAFA